MTEDRGQALLCVPARGGSKRLPRKNLAPLHGRPMLAHTIEAAKRSGVHDTVWVCTEDVEIAEVATGCGAKIHWISDEMTGDEVSSTVPCLDLLQALEKRGDRYEYLFNLQPTSPLREGRDIAMSLDKLIDAGADFLVSVTPIDPHYFHWALRAGSGGWELYFGDSYLQERTQLPPVFRPNGAIKLARAAALQELGHFFGPGLEVYEMPEERSIHVATDFDLTCARGVGAEASKTAGVE